MHDFSFVLWSTLCQILQRLYWQQQLDQIYSLERFEESFQTQSDLRKAHFVFESLSPFPIYIWSNKEYHRKSLAKNNIVIFRERVHSKANYAKICMCAGHNTHVHLIAGVESKSFDYICNRSYRNIPHAVWASVCVSVYHLKTYLDLKVFNSSQSCEIEKFLSFSQTFICRSNAYYYYFLNVLYTREKKPPE